MLTEVQRCNPRDAEDRCSEGVDFCEEVLACLRGLGAIAHFVGTGCLVLAVAGCNPAVPVPPSVAAKPRVVQRDHALVRPRADKVLYEGPTGMAGWIADEPGVQNWQFAAGALQTRSSRWIGRDVHLGERSTIEFTMAGLEVASGFFVGLYVHVPLKVTYEPAYHVANYYTLSIFRESLLFERLDAEGHDQYFGRMSNPHAEWNQPVRVKILCDRPAKRFRVFIDGAAVAEWVDPESFAGEGTGITFQTFEQKTKVQVSEIRVRDGWRE